MRIEAVDREAEQRAADRLEARRGAGQRDELAGADRREIRRMREEDQPAAAELIEANIAHGRARAENRRGIADAQARPAVPGGRESVLFPWLLSAPFRSLDTSFLYDYIDYVIMNLKGGSQMTDAALQRATEQVLAASETALAPGRDLLRRADIHCFSCRL